MIHEPTEECSVAMDSEEAEASVSQSDVGKIQGIRVSQRYIEQNMKYLQGRLYF